ncbi:hypothetical protein TNCV_2642011 [Trichonephila clavipes]|nr:hypothetical protein TNCV_2642011 [Trichonephila clavipes]
MVHAAIIILCRNYRIPHNVVPDVADRFITVMRTTSLLWVRNNPVRIGDVCCALPQTYSYKYTSPLFGYVRYSAYMVELSISSSVCFVKYRCHLRTFLSTKKYLKFRGKADFYLRYFTIVSDVTTEQYNEDVEDMTDG